MNHENHNHEMTGEDSHPSLGEIAVTGLVALGFLGAAAYNFKEGNVNPTVVTGSFGIATTAITAHLWTKRQR
jgi:hypothetical protein